MDVVLRLKHSGHLTKNVGLHLLVLDYAMGKTVSFSGRFLSVSSLTARSMSMVRL